MNLFLISDPHFDHEGTWAKFKRADGSPMRPFKSTEEMNETMVANWNAVVKPSDHVYCLGDVTMKANSLQIIKRLNGHKRLVRGNHDIFKTRLYIAAGFVEVYGVRVFEDMILSHIPLNESCITKRFKVNVHGHIHHNEILHPSYFNVCVEATNYEPISLEDARKRIREKRRQLEGQEVSTKLVML